MTESLLSSYPQEAILERYVPPHGDLAPHVGCNDGLWTRFLAGRFRAL